MKIFFSEECEKKASDVKVAEKREDVSESSSLIAKNAIEKRQPEMIKIEKAVVNDVQELTAEMKSEETVKRRNPEVSKQEQEERKEESDEEDGKVQEVTES